MRAWLVRWLDAGRSPSFRPIVLAKQTKHNRPASALLQLLNRARSAKHQWTLTTIDRLAHHARPLHPPHPNRGLSCAAPHDLYCPSIAS